MVDSEKGGKNCVLRTTNDEAASVDIRSVPTGSPKFNPRVRLGRVPQINNPGGRHGPMAGFDGNGGQDVDALQSKVASGRNGGTQARSISTWNLVPHCRRGPLMQAVCMSSLGRCVAVGPFTYCAGGRRTVSNTIHHQLRLSVLKCLQGRTLATLCRCIRCLL